VPMAHPTTNRVGAVCFDAMYTVLEPVLSRATLEAKIFTDVCGIAVDSEEFMALVTALKRQNPRSGRDMSSYWPPLNRQLLEYYRASGDLDAQARAMHERHYDDPELYAVRDDMRALLEWAAKEVVTIAIASNQRQKRLIELLRHHDALRYFENGGRGTRVFTSERLGASKPSRRFLQRLAQKLGLSSIREMVLIGNSLENDAQAAKLGVRTAILDRSGALGQVPITLPGVTPVDSPAAIRTWIERMLGDAPALGGGNGVPIDEPALEESEDQRDGDDVPQGDDRFAGE
ncbi:MAG: HAD family hydrolase, partial [bacterium]|nr:HAD family hydrolase [bacterium]